MTAGSKDRFSTQVSGETQARVRAAVRGVASATRTDYTLSQLVEEALAAYCDRLEAQYHDGHPWPVVERPLRPGARMG